MWTSPVISVGITVPSRDKISKHFVIPSSYFEEAETSNQLIHSSEQND
jgi:hypothetical protein